MRKKTGVPNMKDKQKVRNFKVSVRLQTGEVFSVSNVHSDMKIKELRSRIEIDCGIPYHLQRLHYLDDADLRDDSDLRHYDVVPGAVITCDVWPIWRTLLEAVAAKDNQLVLSLGVSSNSEYHTPHSDHMTTKSRQAWTAARALVALIMAAHRGNIIMVERLISAGADVNGKTPLGRTSLHIAAGRGNGLVVDYLLEKGADFDEEDDEGNTAATYAAQYGHKDCERHLFLFQWKQRTVKKKPEFNNLPRMAHQYYDSKQRVWLSGQQVQLYYTKILPPGEFEGTSISSPKRRHRPTTAPNSNTTSTPIINKPERNIQVEIGSDTVEPVQNATQVFVNEFNSPLPSKLSKDSAVNISDRLTPKTSQRILSKEPNDSDIYGLVDIINNEARKEKIRKSSYGRGLEYSRAYAPRERTGPTTFDEWVRFKLAKKRAQEEIKLESERMRKEERRTEGHDRQKVVENWSEDRADVTRNVPEGQVSRSLATQTRKFNR